MKEIFETDRLMARAWTLHDVESYFQIYGNAEVVATLHGSPLQTIEEARQKLAARLEAASNEPDGMGFWSIERKADRKVLGSVVLKPLPDDSRIEVGWHLGREYWGNGYATEAGAGALQYGFVDRNLEEIFAIVRETNLPSQRVCDRIGLKYLEITTKYHGLYLRLYRIVRGEWHGFCVSNPVR